MPSQKFLSHVLKSQLMEILKFQFSNVLVQQSQQLASHAHLRHALIAVHAQQQLAQNVKHLNVHVLNVQLQIVRAMIVRAMTAHVLMHHVAKSQRLKRLLMTSVKSQRLVQLSL
jgi:hypothetical protein